MHSSNMQNRRLLVIDDSEAIHDAFRKILCSIEASPELDSRESALFGASKAVPALKFEVDSAHSGEEGLTKVRQALSEQRPYAMTFVDVRMPPGWDGIETLHRIWKEDPQLQAVICSAYSDYSWEQIMARLGQSDQLLILKKPFDNIEARQMAFALTEKWSVARAAQQRLDALLVSQQRLQAIIDNSTTVIYLMDSAGKLVLANRQFENVFNVSRDSIAGKSYRDIFAPDIAETLSANDAKVFETRVPLACEESLPHTDGMHTYLSVKFPLLEGGQRIYALCVIATDISDRIKAEASRLSMERKILETQKLESLGVLASGVAHDFNNMLAVIAGNVSLISSQTPAQSQAREFLTSIETTTQRAAELCRQLIAYSGRGRRVIQPTNLNTLILEMSQMIKVTLGANVALRQELKEGIPPVIADATQIRQVIMNLLINGSEAIGAKPGQIVVRTGHVKLDRQTLETAYSQSNLQPGNYCFVEVVDDGCGMDATILAKLFAPFFSTKSGARGLGLAAVQGIVRGHKGAIKVESELKKGTRFEILLPCENSAQA
jgi:two-component system cell cycle sensor histidine kinase/response regulator CckA